VTIRNNKLITRPYNKPTDNKQYVLPNSCHPKHIINSIPYSQVLRIKRICTDQETFIQELENLKGCFNNRNYPKKIVNQAIQKALSKDVGPTCPINNNNEKPSLTMSNKNEKPALTALIIPYHPSNPPYQKTINTIWHKYQQLLNNLIGKPIVSYKRPQNLREMLKKARYGPLALPRKCNPSQQVTQ
jgi:peptide-methionine (R)-S-oxide reductase